MGISFKAIETRYKGYRFRSRLEARWAVFFDTLRVPFEYEKEGYDLGDAGWYLPDFWLPTIDCWFEVKPNAPTDDARRKAKRLAELSDNPVVISAGLSADLDLVCYAAHRQCADHYGYPGPDTTWAFGICTRCGALSLLDCGFALHGASLHEFESHPHLFGCHCIERGEVYCEGPGMPGYEAAKAARFEHGEHGTSPSRTGGDKWG